MNPAMVGRTEPAALDPSWRPWLDLVEDAVAQSQRPAWSNAVDARASGEAGGAPLLHRATLRVTQEQATGVVRRLTDALGIPAAGDVESLALLLAGVERDQQTLDALADRLAVPTDTVATVSQLSAMPLLLNAARQLDADTSRTWQRGYCPVCGAWPAMAELRGIQRERHLRCGCCGGDWVLPVLRCAFCGETDHRKLGVLLPDESEHHVRVETCATCRGYLKTTTTLGALPFAALAQKDLATVAFDMAARDRGFSRPTVPAWRLEVEMVP